MDSKNKSGSCCSTDSLTNIGYESKELESIPPFVGVAIGVYLFGKISMAHFNPAVTVGFLITKHITKIQLLYYLTAEIIGALLATEKIDRIRLIQFIQ